MIRKTYRSVRCSIVRETTASYEQPKTIRHGRHGRDVAQLLRSMISNETRETFIAVLLDTRNNVIGVHTVSIGTATSAQVHPREVFLTAVALSATGIVVAHNHPSGDPKPSKEDLAVTERLNQAGKLLGIDVLDHVIVGATRYHSVTEGLDFAY